MRIILAATSLILLLGTSCDRNPTVPETKPERPPKLTYGWVLLEGAITIREEAYVGNFMLTCGSNSVTAYSNDGSYSLMLRLEREAATGPVDTCRVDVGQPIIFSRSTDISVATRAESVITTRFDVVLLPDAPPIAQMEKPIVSVAAAGGHTCAVAATGAAYCWGLNRYAELGFGWHLPTTYPARVVTSERFVSVTAAGYGVTYSNDVISSESSASCALRADGAVFCWGDRMRAAMDLDVTAKEASVPQRVMNIPPISVLSGGASKVCGISQSGELYCWGGYEYSPSSQVQKINVSNVIAVDDGQAHACALLGTGRWHCYRNPYDGWGQSGDTTGAPAFKRIAVGNNFMCALDEAGLAWCWGRNDSGQLGRGLVDPGCTYSGVLRMCVGTDVSPKRVATDVRFTDIDAGRNHVCGLAQDGTVYCWGGGSEGQLGDGSSANRTTPVAALGSSGLRFSKLSVGDAHSCAIATDGRLYCWGQGKLGQLGTNGVENRAYPTPSWGQ